LQPYKIDQINLNIKDFDLPHNFVY